MSLRNESAIQLNEQDFHCCCSISCHEFDASEMTGVPTFNSIVLILTSISGTLGNLLVLVSIWKTPSLHSPSNVLLSGLAVSDLGIGLVVEPIFIVYNIAKLKGLATVFCNSAVSLRFTGYLLCFASLFTMTAISVDFNIALYLHLRYKEIVTVKKMIGVLVGVWVCSVTVSLLYLVYRETTWIIWISLLLLCLFVTTSAHYRVFRIVRHHQAQIEAQTQVQEQAEDQDEDPLSIAQHRKSLVSKFLIYCLLLLCYLPYVVMTIVKLSTSFTVAGQTLLEFSYVLLFINSMLNPFVYCWRIQTIRTAVIETTKKILQHLISVP